jgi:hypothetical protein
MHNTPERNRDFQIAFTETNLRWLYGEQPSRPDVIAKMRQILAKLKKDKRRAQRAN